MIGTVKVVKSGAKIDSAAGATRRGQGRAGEVDRRRPGREEEAREERSAKPVKNADGSTTYPVEMGVSTAHTDILGVQARADER